MDGGRQRFVAAGRMQPRRGGRPGGLRMRRQKCRATRREQIAVLGTNETGPGLGGGGGLTTFGVGKETDGSPIGGVKRRDMGDGARPKTGVAQFGPAKARQFLE